MAVLVDGITAVLDTTAEDGMEIIGEFSKGG
jgi:hypothetical protein